MGGVGVGVSWSGGELEQGGIVVETGWVIQEVQITSCTCLLLYLVLLFYYFIIL